MKSSSTAVSRFNQALAEQAEASHQTALRFHELAESDKRVDRWHDELARNPGGLGNKFGTFTKGLVWSSLQRIFRERLPDGRELDVHMLGWSNGTDNRIAVDEVLPPMGREVSRRGFHLAKASDKNFELADAPGFRSLTLTA